MEESNIFRGNPMVSVVMNALNSEEYLVPAIKSVISQTVSDWEIVFWDNGSTDATAEIAQSFQDQRIRYFYAPDQASLYESRVNAMRMANGKFIAFLDCDDVWLPQKLEKQIEVFEDPRCVISCTDYVIDRMVIAGKSLRPSKSTFHTYAKSRATAMDVLSDYRVGMSSMMLRTQACMRVIPDPPPPYYMLEDVDIVTRMMTVGILCPVNESLMIYRRHGNNYSSRANPFNGEWESWIVRIDELNCDPKEQDKLRKFGSEQLIRTRFRTALLEGDRLEGRKYLSRMPFSPSKVKMFFILLLPTSLVWKLIR